MGKKVILTGSTGMVGHGVLLECLDSEAVSTIILLNRNSVGIKHPKIYEILIDDIRQVEKVESSLTGIDACFYCMGVSAVGLSEEKYHDLTYNIAANIFTSLYKLNPDMVSIYVSGQGTDSSESGSSMWARVKGKTENMVFNLGGEKAYAFRPGMIIPERDVKSKTSWYNTLYVIMRPLFPLFKLSKRVTTTVKLGKAMINILIKQPPKKILTNPDINRLATD
ncbi:MAG: epimerase [Saprospiraceae bacterium]|nr:epimerase [Saprospiraceae bacterium]